MAAELGDGWPGQENPSQEKNQEDFVVKSRVSRKHQKALISSNTAFKNCTIGL
jgi:hypothetical protein